MTSPSLLMPRVVERRIAWCYNFVGVGSARERSVMLKATMSCAPSAYMVAGEVVAAAADARQVPVERVHASAPSVLQLCHLSSDLSAKRDAMKRRGSPLIVPP